MYVSADMFWVCFITTASLLSDVTDIAAFSSLVPSQHHVSRHKISEGRSVTIFEEDGERLADIDSYYSVAGASGKGGVG